MNILEFEVHNQILERIDSQDIVNMNKNIYKCRFTFEEESEWANANKFVIFTDGWGNSSTVHLGKESNVLSCLVPDKVLRGSYFQVSVYAGDLVTTNNVSIALIQSGYNRENGFTPHPVHHHPNRYYHPAPHHHEYCCNDEDIFVEIFDRLDNSIDSIIYDNNTLHLFCREKLMESIYLPFVSNQEVQELVNDLVTRFINTELSTATTETDGLLSKEDKLKLDTIEIGANMTLVDDSLDGESDNAISNRVVKQALDGKEDSYDIVERIDDLIVNLINKGE